MAFVFNPKTQRIPASAQTSLADHNYRRSFVSLDDNISFSGLTHTPGKDGVYVRALTGTLIQRAHELAKDWKHTEPSVYYTFLLAALTVPMHESTLMHFTKRSPEQFCYFSNDFLANFEENYSALKALPLTRTVEIQIQNANFLRDNFERFFQSSGMNASIFKTCDELNHKAQVQQILFSNDYADVGLMMLNSTSHGDFFASGKIFRTDEVIKYGLNFLYDGFEEIVVNSNEHLCLSEAQGLEYHKRLIQGVWAGKYNSGNTSRTCRFTDLDHRFSTNDRGFETKLAQIFDGTSVYHNYLPINSIERNFFIQLIENFHQPENLTIPIDQILNTNYQTVQDVFEENIETEPGVIVLSDDSEVEIGESHNDQLVVLEDNNLDVSLPIENNNQMSDRIADHINQEITQEIYMNQREEPLPPVLGPEPVSQEISSYEIWMGNLEGEGVNLRTSPELLEDNICVNTLALETNPVNFEVRGVSGEFFEIENQNTDLCDQSSVFVHQDYVKVSYENTQSEDLRYEVKLVRLDSWVSKRDQHGLANSTVLGVLGPQVLEITSEYIYLNRYTWYSTIDSTGESVWFYAGEVGNLITEEVE